MNKAEKQKLRFEKNVARIRSEREKEELRAKKAEAKLSRPPRRKRHLLRKTILALFSLLTIAVVAGAVYISRLDAWHAFDPNKITNVHQTLLMYDRDLVQVAGLHGTENRLKVPLSSVPYLVQKAFISAEDVRFYQHPGFDVQRIVGALWEDIKTGRPDQGASTITQQLIKLSHLTNEKTFSRKIQEAILAYQMEQHFSKDQILEMYLNFVYFGKGAYGIEAAAQEYFGRNVENLTVAQGAMLAGILKSPSNYAPHLHMDASVERRNLVLSLMEKYGYLTAEECETAQREPALLTDLTPEAYPYGFYTDAVMDEAMSILGVDMETLLSGGYHIETALDRSLQTYVETLFEDDALFPPQASDGARVEGAFVAIDPKNHEVTALVGGREHTVRRGFNRATHLKRQPGSAIKPVLVYAPAIESFGYTAATFVLDEQSDFGGYIPRDFSTASGWVTMREAITRSLNIPAVKVFNDIGIYVGKKFAQSIGITFDDRDNNLALALGGFTRGISPMELCGAYSMFAAEGEYAPANLIRRITDADGNELYTHQPKAKRVMSEANAYVLTSMLKDVVQNGTARRLQDAGIPLAGKTGTTGIEETGGNKDAWMVAYNSEIVMTVWMGFDKTDDAHSLESGVTGGTFPASLLTRVFQYAYKDKEAPEFRQPDDVREVRLDVRTLRQDHVARLANALTPPDQVVYEVFSLATLPSMETDYWVVPSPPGLLTANAGEDGKPVIRFTPVNEFARYQLFRQSREGGEPLLLGEYPGDGGEIMVVDSLAHYGSVYEYYVVPIHPDLTLEEQPISGPASMRVTYYVPSESPELEQASVTEDEPRNTPSPSPGAAPSPSPTSIPTPSPTSIPTPSRTSSFLSTPTPSRMPTPSPSAKPVSTPAP